MQGFCLLVFTFPNNAYSTDSSFGTQTGKSVSKAKGHLTGTVIYGYLWADEKRNKWIVDEEATTEDIFNRNREDCEKQSSPFFAVF